MVEGRERGGEGGKEMGVENSRESGRDGQAHDVETYGKKDDSHVINVIYAFIVSR